MGREDGGEDGKEVWVGCEVPRGDGEGVAGADGELLYGRVAGEKREEVFGGVHGVRMHVLWSQGQLGAGGCAGRVVVAYDVWVFGQC